MNPFKSLKYSTLITDMKIIRAISVTQPNWYWWPILANRYQYISVSTGIDIYAISVTQPNRYWLPILATDIIIYRSIGIGIHAISVIETNRYWWPILVYRYQRISVKSVIVIYTISALTTHWYTFGHQPILTNFFHRYRQIFLTDIGYIGKHQ